jgi:hypothetical protein
MDVDTYVAKITARRHCKPRNGATMHLSKCSVNTDFHLDPNKSRKILVWTAFMV